MAQDAMARGNRVEPIGKVIAMPPMRILLWVASAGGVATGIRAWIVGAPPMWVAIAALLGYSILSTAGWIFPGWQMYGDIFCRGTPRRKVLALTFDDGPSPKTTPRVLDMLKSYGIVATFCVIGSKAERYPDLVKRMVEEGHSVAMHSYHHQRLFAWQSPSRIARDIERCRELIEAITGSTPRWFRPPIGHVSPRVVAGAARAGARLLGFSGRGLDGLSNARPDRVLKRLTKAVKPGAIIMLHDASEREDFEPVSIGVLPSLVQLFNAGGLRVVSVDELWASFEDQ